MTEKISSSVIDNSRAYDIFSGFVMDEPVNVPVRSIKRERN
jgi:hypothetical protein